MKELVEVIAKKLVDNPDEVVVTEKKDGRNIIIELHVAPQDMGKVIGANGKIYNNAAAAKADNNTMAVAMIVYVGSATGESSPYNHGLALAMSDVDYGNTFKWKTESTDAGHTKQTSSSFTSESGLQYNSYTPDHNSDTYPAFKNAIDNDGTATPTGCSAWFLPTGYQWNQMINACKNVLGTKNSYEDLRDGFTNAGGTNLQSSGYWSATEVNAEKAWRYYFSNGLWSRVNKGDDIYHVRSALAF